MDGFDDHVADIGNWIPPSPSPSSRALFSSLLAGDVGGWPPHMEETNERIGRNFVVEPQEHVTWCNSDGKDGDGTGATTDQTVKSSAPSEKETSSRGGLMERMVARAGFNVPMLNTDGLRPPAMSQNQEVKSPYLSIAAGLSPSVLLYSPVLIYNSVVNPSPTTGLLPCATGDETNSLMLMTGAADKRKETSFGSNPIMETGRVDPSSQIEVSLHPSNSLEPQSMEATQNERICHETTETPLQSTEEDVQGSDIMPEVKTTNVVGGSTEHSPSLDEKQDEDTDDDDSVEDGYNWKKYGQNQLKGSEYPRSYYKCIHPNCFVKKEIARHHKGHVTEIIYNGIHNHPKPPPKWIDPTGTGVNGELALVTTQQGPIAGGLEGNDNQLGSADTVDISSTFSNNEDDRGTRGSAFLGSDDEGDESESKIRKIEVDETDTSGASRPIRAPRVVVQTVSEIDVLDDGYRWRKYGQKMVKGSPYPRSYYKCTNPGCNVRKHIERAPFDQQSVITTYDGKHNHDVPAVRSSNRASSSVSNSRSKLKTTNAEGHVGKPEPKQTKKNNKLYGRAPPLGSVGSTSGSNSSETNQQQDLTGLAMTVFNSDQHQFSAPAHPHTGCPQPVNDAGFVLPEGEPMPDPSLNYSSASSQQVMNGLPPEPQM